MHCQMEHGMSRRQRGAPCSCAMLGSVECMRGSMLRPINSQQRPYPMPPSCREDARHQVRMQVLADTNSLRARPARQLLCCSKAHARDAARKGRSDAQQGKPLSRGILRAACS